MRFEWTEEYSVGIDKLDEQHQQLFSMGNDIEAATVDDAKEYVMKLYKYARVHFAEEENHMAEIDFPALPEHRALHTRLCQDFSDVIEYGISDEGEFRKFQLFLYEWLTQHVMRYDKRYFEYTKNLDQKGTDSNGQA